MTALTLCRLTVQEARHLGLAPSVLADGWVAVHPDCRDAVATTLGDNPAGRPWADCLAMLPTDWAEALRRPVSRELAQRIAAELERVARWTDTSAHGTPPVEIAARVRVWLGESYEFPGCTESHHNC